MSNNSEKPKKEQEKESITMWAGKDGSFKRENSHFRNQIEKGGKYPPEKGRYHLYVSRACPWAHRTLIVRHLKGLEDFIDVSVVHPHMLEGGWHFVPKSKGNSPPAPADQHDYDTFPGATVDHNYGFKHLSELYFKAEKDYNGRYTVPILWDTKDQSIVNNESSELIKILNREFNEMLPTGAGKDLDLYPEDLREEIDTINEWVYDDLSNGVYKTGFATKQAVYDEAVVKVFESLDRVEKVLSDGREFLVGGKLTMSDVRLYTTAVRFDPVYFSHFKCNHGSIRHDYPYMHKWLRNLYWKNPAFKETTDFPQIREHYYVSQRQLNPTSIVPSGPRVMIEPLDK